PAAVEPGRRRPERTFAHERRRAPGLLPALRRRSDPPLLVYLLITILRSVRADFAPEIWGGLQQTVPPAIFAWSELAVAAGVLVLSGSAVLIGDNRRAFFFGLALAVGGAVLVRIAPLPL